MTIAASLFSVVAAFAAFILLLDVLGTTFAKDNLERRKLVAIVIFPMMMAYCLTHTVQIGEVVVDPRYVPLTLAIFAGGWPALLATMLTGIAMRIGIGGPNTMIAIISFLMMSGISAAMYTVFRATVRPLPVKLIVALALIVNAALVPLFLFTTASYVAMTKFVPQLILVNIIGIIFTGLHIRYIQQRNLLVERLASENAQKSRFLGVMGHEMRSPLNAIMGYTYAVNEASNAKDTSEAMEKIRASSRHAIGMFENLLDATRIEAGALNVTHHAFDLRQLFDLIDDQMRPAIERKKLGFYLCIADDVPNNVQTDEFRLRQVIVNLIDNATKYTAKGSICVRVSASGSHIKQLKVLIEDTGMGIASDDLETIFKPYQQTDKAESLRRAGISGAGLGLSIVDGLVHALEGTISIESVQSEGTTCTFTVPIKVLAANELPETSLASSSASSRQTTSPRILVVDDDEANRKVTGVHLEVGGYEYSSAENGAEALEYLEKERFDLVLVDRYMPVMDGLTFSRAVRSHERPAIRQTKILLVTGAGSDDAGIKDALGLVDQHIQKPINYPALGSIIDGHMTSSGVHEQEGGNVVSLQSRKS